MAHIDIEVAEQKMFELLDKEDIGDRIYEFAQELYQKYIRQIEADYTIDNKDILDRCEEWYDRCYEDFFQSVYERMIDFLTARY